MTHRRRTPRASLAATAALLLLLLSASSAGARTVAFGRRTLHVPRSGLVTVRGETILVPSGTRRLVLVDAPPSTSALPVWPSRGDEFSFLGRDATATSVRAFSAGSVTAERAQASGTPHCTPQAYTPSSPAASNEVQGSAETTCSGADNVIEIAATLYWSATANPYHWKFQSVSPVEYGTYTAQALTTTSCHAGNRGYWHTLNTTNVVDRTNGVTYAWHANSANALLTCS